MRSVNHLQVGLLLWTLSVKLRGQLIRYILHCACNVHAHGVNNNAESEDKENAGSGLQRSHTRVMTGNGQRLNHW